MGRVGGVGSGAGFHKGTVDATAKANNEIEQKVGEVYTGLTHAF